MASIHILYHIIAVKISIILIRMYYLCIHMEKELQITADGSHTLYIPAMDEHYHSVNGALQESRHIFIEAGLHALEKRLYPNRGDWLRYRLNAS